MPFWTVRSPSIDACSFDEVSQIYSMAVGFVCNPGFLTGKKLKSGCDRWLLGLRSGRRLLDLRMSKPCVGFTVDGSRAQLLVFGKWKF